MFYSCVHVTLNKKCSHFWRYLRRWLQRRKYRQNNSISIQCIYGWTLYNWWTYLPSTAIGVVGYCRCFTCPSVRPTGHPSVFLSVCMVVRPSVRPSVPNDVTALTRLTITGIGLKFDGIMLSNMKQMAISNGHTLSIFAYSIVVSNFPW